MRALPENMLWKHTCNACGITMSWSMHSSWSSNVIVINEIVTNEIHFICRFVHLLAFNQHKDADMWVLNTLQIFTN